MCEGLHYTASCNTCGWEGSPKASPHEAHQEGAEHRRHCETRCPCCLGSGYTSLIDHNETDTCPACDGEGTMEAYERGCR